MNYQHVENLLIRYRGQAVNIKSVSGSTYEGTISDVTKIVGLPVKVPGVGQTVDCTTSLTECLLKLGNPLDCAAQAQSCVTK